MGATYVIKCYNPLPSQPLFCVYIALFVGRICDKLRMYWLATQVRKFQGLFEGNFEAQTKWIQRMKQLALGGQDLIQRNIFLTHLVVDLALQNRLQMISSIDNEGFRNWKDKLAAVAAVRDDHARNKQAMYENLLHKPTGSQIRQHDTELDRASKQAVLDPGQSLSNWSPDLVYQCCLKLEGLDPNEKVFHSHCTGYCRCCIHHTGSTVVDKRS
ncbi:hypothetical protein FQN57_005958 [Myotisia sp. PD_48]|nr:hypothetical protein FQN57_005958 [Myotisia sp. PD_48]